MTLPSLNYFSIFNLEPNFFINLELLKNKYHELSKIYHPDIKLEKINTASRNLLLDFPMISKAYKTLTNDLKRAQYLISMNNQNEALLLNKEFLIEILDLEEEISDIKNRNDLKELKVIEAKIDQKIQECKENYHDKLYILKWKYFERLKKMINA